MKEMVCKAADVKLIIHCSDGPWEIWSANKYRCPQCGSEVLTEFGESCVDILRGYKRFSLAYQNALKEECYNASMDKLKN